MISYTDFSTHFLALRHSVFEDAQIAHRLFKEANRHISAGLLYVGVH